MVHKAASESEKKEPTFDEVRDAIKKAITLPLPVRIVRNLIALGLWGGLFCQLFLFDFGAWLIELLPNFELIFRYRFLVAVSLVSLAIAGFWSRFCRVFFAYILLFPFLIPIWVIPKFLIKNWVLLIAFWPAIHSFIRTLRFTLVLWVAVLVAFFLIITKANSYMTMASMAILALYLIIHYVRRFRTAFASQTGFSDFVSVIEVGWENTVEQQRKLEPIEEKVGSKEYKQKLGQRLLNLYTTTSVLFAMGEKLQQVIRTRKLDIYLMCSLAYTFMITVLGFALASFALESIQPLSFEGVIDPNLLDFLGFSFSNALGASISPIVAVSAWAQGIAYAGLTATVILAFLLLFVLGTTVRERYREDLDRVVDKLRETTCLLEKIFEDDYDLTLAGAEGIMLQFNPLIARWLLKLRHGEERAKNIPGYSRDEDIPLIEEGDSEN